MSRRRRSPAELPQPSTMVGNHTVIEVKAGVFKDTCLQLLDQVHDEEVEVVVTKHGAPVARLVSPDVRLPSAFGFLRGTVSQQHDIVSPDPDAWGDLG